MSTAAPTSRPMVVVLPQPKSLPRTSAKTSRKRLTENVTKPTQSICARPQVLRLGDLGERDEDGDDADGHVDEEDPAPADAARDGAADERADGDGAADHGAVDAEGGPAVPPGERGGDQGQRGGEHDGAPDALHGAGQVEHERRRRQAADQRGEREDDQADGEDLAPPVDVAEPPRRSAGRRPASASRRRRPTAGPRSSRGATAGCRAAPRSRP